MMMMMRSAAATFNAKEPKHKKVKREITDYSWFKPLLFGRLSLMKC